MDNCSNAPQGTDSSGSARLLPGCGEDHIVFGVATGTGRGMPKSTCVPRRAVCATSSISNHAEPLPGDVEVRAH